MLVGVTGYVFQPIRHWQDIYGLKIAHLRRRETIDDDTLNDEKASDEIAWQSVPSQVPQSIRLGGI